ncbi:RNA polymerase sigma-70 [Macleaya cordata]|uniref:RNA polymerase sigma-70 n=1 Tax=Macleaya cordata TaxID=56857 RepID=A0A200QDG7_MACCD|nr:RNA polymerase sigma-70 [Macleaya cordata]
MVFRLDWKWVFPVQSSFPTNSSTKLYSSSVRGKEVSYESARVSILSVIPDESEPFIKDPFKAYACSSGALEIMESSSVEMEEMKMVINKGSYRTLYNPIDGITIPMQDERSTSASSLRENKTSYFSLLMDSLEKVEEIFVDADLVRLERDILIQLGKLGALNLFRACLSRNVKTTTLSLSIPVPKLPKDSPTSGAVNDQVINVTVLSGRKEERKSKRKRALEKAANISASSPAMKRISKTHQRATSSSNKKSRRLIIAKNESEMSWGVKDVANLERIRTILEEETGRMASFSSWAEAVGIDEKVLKQRLHFGWYCRDKLLKSTCSLVLYLARNYRGLGISLEDLLQAGNMGVLQGAERFDHTRGYRFSTYVQYWIRKSMSTFVARNSRGIQIPVTLARAIYQIQKARRSLHSLHGRYPDDNEIAMFTGLSLNKIRLASKCPRIVGSINQKMGDSLSVKFMEFTSDTSMESPEQIVMKQHMQKDIYDLLENLQQRERQVLILRQGLWDGQCKSLEEIGKLFNVTKEWIRKIEKSALNKVRKEEVQRNLSHYLNL